MRSVGGGARFSAPVQTRPGAYPASYTMGTGFFPRVMQPGRCVDYPHTSSAEVKERVELYFCSPRWTFVACSTVNLTYFIRSIQHYKRFYGNLSHSLHVSASNNGHHRVVQKKPLPQFLLLLIAHRTLRCDYEPNFSKRWFIS
jgi:hypothetical protein